MKINNSLDRLRIASPCPVTWDAMTGDERVRTCDECNLQVYNIGAMTRAEAETLIARTEGRLCARIYRRADGTVITRDCPVGLRAIRRRVARSATAVFAAVVAFAAAAFGQKPGSKDQGSCRQQVIITRELNQTGYQKGEVSGTILDANGAVIANANITITSESQLRTFSRAPAKPLTTSSDDKGEFRVAGLQTGNYTLTVEMLPFKKLQVTAVKVATNEKIKLELTLLVDTTTVTMGIIAIDSPIDSPPGRLIITDKMIQRLPIHED